MRGPTAHPLLAFVNCRGYMTDESRLNGLLPVFGSCNEWVGMIHTLGVGGQ